MSAVEPQQLSDDEQDNELIALADEADRILAQDDGSRWSSDASRPIIIPST